MVILFNFKEHPLCGLLKHCMTSMKIMITVAVYMYINIGVTSEIKERAIWDIFVEAFNWTLKAPSVYICFWLKHCIDCSFSTV